MAIKIKNKGSNEPEEPEGDGQQGAPAGGGSSGGGLDGFERISFSVAAWVEDNRGVFLGMIGVTVVVIIAIVTGIIYVRGQQMEASERLSEGLLAYEQHVDGAPEEIQHMWMEQEDMEVPVAFDSISERWQAVYEHAGNTLDDFDGGAIAPSARMTRAAAALNLGEYEEAEQLYRDVVDAGGTAGAFLATAYMGLANSLAAQQQLDEAEDAWREFAELRPAQSAYAELEIARMYERAGDTDEARDRYDRFVEDFEDSEHISEVERRRALL